ncbi:protein-glutamate methylesterase/protein-glutamine glutaminase [Geoalkalibacter sp.]|uniref:protein-glutamate methylesterase/protein-glutamine glutaminase n=1 Tax=Geoalkalibacter sp. TaxID=3041440 RepID=UPI00272E9524|nr:chemotaxis response regulator protein-glutamate methylesterase [Geoalkalibacter sp.]
MSAKSIKVLIVDDSALIRKILTEIIDNQADMQVVGAAADPLIARQKIKELNPDVLTLDVEMPRMDGLVFLEKLMRLRPMPVVMVSSLTERNSLLTLHALELGAVDFVTKPKLDIAQGIHDYAEEITAKIRAAAVSRHARGGVAPLPVPGERRVCGGADRPRTRMLNSTEKVILMGASTGGTEAIREVLTRMPPDAPAILVTQHMPEGFTRTFAKRLDQLCRIRVKEAEDGERVLPGHAYIAPGNRHLLLQRSGANYLARLSDAPPVNRHRPSVDVLFQSAAQHAGNNAVGIILTGMGNDGAAGLRLMKDAGAYTLAQDEESCVVFGMPKEAIALGAAERVLPLREMADKVFGHLHQAGRAVRI